MRKFDLRQQLSEVLSVLTHLVNKTPISLKAELEEGIVMHSYPGPIGQVVTNLVMNSIKHGFVDGQVGEILVSCRQLGSIAIISVRDNGAGISPENIHKIFDPFFTTKLGQGGSGLGLHICHNIVMDLLGGRISVESELGKGCVFQVELPIKVTPKLQSE